MKVELGGAILPPTTRGRERPEKAGKTISFLDFYRCGKLFGGSFRLLRWRGRKHCYVTAHPSRTGRHGNGNKRPLLRISSGWRAVTCVSERSSGVEREDEESGGSYLAGPTRVQVPSAHFLANLAQTGRLFHFLLRGSKGHESPPNQEAKGRTQIFSSFWLMIVGAAAAETQRSARSTTRKWRFKPDWLLAEVVSFCSWSATYLHTFWHKSS